MAAGTRPRAFGQFTPRIDISQCGALGRGDDTIMGATDADFRALYDANRGSVRGLLARMAGPQNADDLTQATFAKAAKAMAGFRGDAEAATWLRRIAINVALDWLRSRPTHEAALSVPLDLADAESVAETVERPATPEQEVAEKDMKACFRGEIAKLPATYRDVLTLSALGELDDEEIATALGISQSSAKVRLHRARDAFKKIIAARCDFYQQRIVLQAQFAAMLRACACARAIGRRRALIPPL